jgi:hypothetical protein
MSFSVIRVPIPSRCNRCCTHFVRGAIVSFSMCSRSIPANRGRGGWSVPSAPRTLVLCWSEHAQGSDYITFEYSKAEAHGKPVYPWLIDKTPLPAMLDLQGIASPDGAHVAQVLRPYLGWTLHRRHLAVAGALVILLAFFSAGLWRALHPPQPPPWQFEGTVIDNVEQMPIAGIEVDLDIGDGHPHPAWTDAKGKYCVQLPAPRPATFEIRFRKTGYQADTVLHAKASEPYDEILIPEQQPNTKEDR